MYKNINTSYVMEPISWLQPLELTSTKMQGLLGIIYYICVSLEHIDTYYIKGHWAVAATHI